jgi:ABC-type uncharacterized transport system involved in gliding motility auxiliary subunit
MKLSARLHQQLYLKNLAITTVILTLLSGLAVVSYRYNTEFDVTANNNNTLSVETQKVLAGLPEPVTVTVYIKTGHPLKSQVKLLLERYRRHKANLKIQFVDPEKNLAKAKELNVGSQGLIVVEYQGRSEKIAFLDESSLTNTLLQLAKSKERWVSFLTGHGERSPTGVANFDFGSFSKDLKQRSIKAQALNLAELGTIPDNSAVLVLASPRVPLLAGELNLIQNYLKQGGNLLLLSDPEDKHTLAIEQFLGVQKSTEALIDTSSKMYGIDDPHFVLVTQYGRHPITQGMENITVYPGTVALTANKGSGFEAVPILKKDTATIGYALTRAVKGKSEQRIVVISDGDFLSNTFLGNVGNMEMGLRIFNWLTHDDQFIDVPIKAATGRSLQLSPMAIGIIGFGFLLVLPLGLIGTGFFVWRSRKRR